VNEFEDVVGYGRAAYDVAAEALRGWEVMEGVASGGIVCEAAAPEHGRWSRNGTGRGVATIAQSAARLLWVLNPCRQACPNPLCPPRLSPSSAAG
jgi:hypothetical protein